MIVFDEYFYSEEEYSDQYSHTIIITETLASRENFIISNSDFVIFKILTYDNLKKILVFQSPFCFSGKIKNDSVAS